jgi:hypothetical protein
MVYAATTFQWTFAPRGTRTRIWSGPLVHAVPVPVQWLIFANRAVAGSGPDLPLTFLLTAYSAAAPWYLTVSGAAMAWNWPLEFPNPPQLFPWDAGYPLWFLSTPWLEVFVTPSIGCLAQLRVM